MIISISDLSDIDPKDVYFVDANVILFIYLDKEYNQDTEKRKIYMDFIKYLQKNGNVLRISTLNLQEVLHVVEKKEFKGYCQTQNSKVSLKNYRKNRYERHKLKQKLDLILRQITQSYSIEDDSVTKEDIEAFVSGFETHLYDPMDFFAVHSRCRPGCCFNYITDDSDFKNNLLFQKSRRTNLYTCAMV
ncbi:hypothetical protein [Methanolapillus millepedarum]|uniref:PIN domain-containing protein n=1 Tax=Methanolapillus millepedarum TaxID=3028296 RepID=A0AA96V3V5_9EURY|nr:hypothetical protein MsAc7_05370 [Methanosarcinaceae archaeon Ac7]